MIFGNIILKSVGADFVSTHTGTDLLFSILSHSIIILAFYQIVNL
mgnify:CR=1 FL=1